jgi:CheY-like chemotaxis protein
MPASGHTNEGSKFLNTLRLTDRDSNKLLQALDRRGTNYQGLDRRGSPRHPYRPGSVSIEIIHPGGSTGQFLDLTRNLSKTGISLLHGGFVYTGTKCIVNLRTIDNEELTAAGGVVRCQHIQGHIHELGIHFDEPIDLTLFVEGIESNQDSSGTFTPKVKLHGHVLYIEDSINDRELIRYVLRAAGVEMTAAANGIEGLDLVRHDTFDLILTDMHLPEMSGPEVVAKLRSSGYPGPIIGITADDSADMRQKAITAGCSDVLAKPVDFDALLYGLAKHLTHDGSTGKDLLMSSRWSDLELRPLILAFLKRLSQKVDEMNRAASAQSIDALDRLLLELRGSAEGYGYATVGKAADQTLKALREAGAASDHVRARLSDLINLCNAARKAADET